MKVGEMTARQRRAAERYRRTPKQVGVRHWVYVEKAGLALYCESASYFAPVARATTRMGIIPWRTIRASFRAKPTRQQALTL